MPNTRLSETEEVPIYEAGTGSEVAGSTPCARGSSRELESDYYLGGYDIDSDYPPPHEEQFLSEDQLPPPLPTDEDFPEPYLPVPSESTLNSGSNACQHARSCFHPSQYLPPHQLPPGELPHGDASPAVSGVSTGNLNTDNSLSHSLSVCGMSVGASLALDLDLNSEHGSNFESKDELRRGVTIISDSQQQTEV